MKRFRRKIIRFDISFDKNPETIQKRFFTKGIQYYSDGYNGYFSLNYHGGKYKYLNNKSQTHNIGVKGVNSDFRKYIQFLQRKSKCFLRSLETFKAVFKVFCYIYNKFPSFKRKFSNLKNIYLINFI